jgi:hypothetical protein
LQKPVPFCFILHSFNNQTENKHCYPFFKIYEKELLKQEAADTTEANSEAEGDLQPA